MADPAHAVMERLDRSMARANAARYATHDPFRDFTTSPEITQVFGEILGLWAAATWKLIVDGRTRCCWWNAGRAAAR